MRIYLHLTPNTSAVPFNYQQRLVGAFHKWLGENELHDDISLYSLSWLSGGRLLSNRRGLDFPAGAELFISSPLKTLHQQALDGIFKDAAIAWGMKVEEVRLRPTPNFGERKVFPVQSPVFIQRHLEGRPHPKYYLYHDEEADACLTETLRRKLVRFGLAEEVSVRFDRSYARAHKKLVTYRNMQLAGSICPVIIEGSPRALQFAWEVGVGNSTGIGFGALR
ncbi:MAG: CRISPR-associated endoribonuclease Cas6 [Bacteroidota bacterium]